MNKLIIFVFVFLAIIFTRSVDAFQCNVCHSKKPEMVAMHKALEFKDCFECHGVNSKKGRDEFSKRKQSDEKCTPCHKKG